MKRIISILSIIVLLAGCGTPFADQAFVMGWDNGTNVSVTPRQLVTDPTYTPYLDELLELWEAEQQETWEYKKDRTIRYIKALRKDK